MYLSPTIATYVDVTKNTLQNSTWAKEACWPFAPIKPELVREYDYLTDELLCGVSLGKKHKVFKLDSVIMLRDESSVWDCWTTQTEKAYHDLLWDFYLSCPYGAD